MGVFSGWQSAIQSAAATVANLVGQDIVARSYRATQASGSNSVSVNGGSLIQLALDAGAGLATLSSNAAGQVVTLAANGAGFVFNGAAGVLFAPSGGGFATQGAGTYALSASTSAYKITNVWASAVAPTVTAGAGASIVANNGTGGFSVNLGGAASTGTITLPTATTGWVLYAQNITHPDANVIGQTGFTQTSATFTNYVRTTGVAGNWSANDVMVCIALGF